MNYVIDYDICAVTVCIFIFICIFIKKETRHASNKVFLMLAIAEMLTSIFDAASAVANTRIYEYSTLTKDIFNYLFFGIYNCMPVLFLLYIILIFEIHHRISKKMWVLLSLPVVVDTVLLAFNSVFRWVFYYDENLVYRHGGMFILLYINAFIYLFLAVILIVKYHSALSRLRYYSLIFFIVLAIVPVVVQTFIPRMLIELFFHSLGLLGVMLAIENKDEIYNSTTRIYNRFLFINDVNLAIRTNTDFEILTLKLPKAEYMNATLGVGCMNGFKTVIAKYLKGLAPGISVYDCEHGHFTILIFKNRNIDREQLLRLIGDRFRSEWIFEDTKMIFPIQVCTIRVPHDARNIDQVMFIVDQAYENKDNNKQVVFLDNPEDYTRVIEVEQALERALVNQAFEVYYQPIYDCKAARIRSAEALIRLKDEKLGFIPPDEFIPIAEKNGIIIEIGLFVFEEVCKCFSDGSFEKIGIDYVEVNLSVVQCMNKNLVADFTDILKSYHVPTKCINFEITESAAASNEAVLQQTITELKNVGFTFSLDDYGTGYSNFSYMFNMPFRIVKLDKSILWKAQESEIAGIVLTDTIRMMKRMNLEIVVEGVETEEQRKLLEELNCDYLQGYYFSKPICKEWFIEFCLRFRDDGNSGN